MNSTQITRAKCHGYIRRFANNIIVGFSKEVNKAILIFNEYDDQEAISDGWIFLPGVKDDRRIWKNFLENRYDIVEGVNLNDIEKFVRDLLPQWQDEKIDRLHFHFSGHGIFNQTIHAQISDQGTSSTRASDTPFGECLLGNNGDKGLCSILEIQKLLTDFHPNIITVTLDCCRTLDRPKCRIELAKLPKVDNEDWKKIATIYASCLTQPAYDTRFSKELEKVVASTKSGRIPINKIARCVNESWHKKGFNAQVCTHAIVEIGDNWDKLFFPL